MSVNEHFYFRLEHGSSAPCLISAVSNESVDSGISRSPTPNKQQSVNANISYDQMKPYHVLPSLEKKYVYQNVFYDIYLFYFLF